MKNKSIIVSPLLILFIFCCSFAKAQGIRSPGPGPNGSWKLLGQVTAGSGNDHDIIIVKGPYDYFRKLKFKATNSPLTVYRMVVTYQDGLPEKLETRNDIAKGGESRVIDLKGGRRKIKTVEFWYESKGIFNGKADVTLFGMK